MKSKFLLKWSLLIVAIVGIVCASMIILSLTIDLSKPQNLIVNATDEYIPSIASLEQVSSTLPILPVRKPVRLKIPKIHVDAAVESVGLAPDGSMDVPKDPADVAWFNLGSPPWENGSAVIAGHYGWKNGEAAVFDNLYKLRKGDKIYVEDDLGVTIVFVVHAIRRYAPNADTKDVFGSSDGKSHLNLITCEGTWDKRTKQYSKRLVVFTDKE